MAVYSGPTTVSEMGSLSVASGIELFDNLII
jgi:hypothetical protein